MIKDRLENLRTLFSSNNFAGYIVPTTDEYLSEYTPKYAKRLEYITGFTGSNGLAVILMDTVLFFTDGRYINQCFRQLDDTIFEVFDLQLLANFKWSDYIDSDEIIAYDSRLFTEASLRQFHDIKLQAHTENLIDIIWLEQPSRPSSEIYDHPLQYAGEDYQSKIEKCRNILGINASQNFVLTDPDSVCWLLNIRAHDVEFSPLLLAHAVISKDQVYLFVDSNRLDKFLVRDGVSILPEQEFAAFITNLQGFILFDNSHCSSYISSLIKSKEYKIIENPCNLLKACKNDVEIKHIQQGHIQDAVAVCEMLAFIDQEDIKDLTEYDLGRKLTELRAKGKDYVFDSFPTICGYQNNGAIIHYCAEEKSAKKITGQGLLLIDSGGQYLGATTDITRTVSIGTPTDAHKKYYTKVLKGHIALARAVFPNGKISGAHLDILARQYLWNEGDDYAHGTGHGVGSFLSVHEGPQNISLYSFNVKLSKGMVVSNEPGYYVPDEFGIRIENMMYVQNSKYSNFLHFQMLTLVPYAKDLIEQDMLNKDEIEYIRSYNLEIHANLEHLLSKNAQRWLSNQKI